MSWTDRAMRLGRVMAVGAALVGIGLVNAPHASADDCSSTFSIIPADGSFSYAITPICDGTSDTAADGTSTSPDIVISTPGGVVVTNSGNAVTGAGAVGYTSPGNTPYVNGQPDRSPYSNISLYTPSQAAAARASGNPSATANAYSQYGGFTPPGNTATRSNPSSTVLQSH